MPTLGVEKVRLLHPCIPPEGGIWAFQKPVPRPPFLSIHLGLWDIVPSCAFVEDKRPLVEQSSSKYAQAWEAMHLKTWNKLHIKKNFSRVHIPGSVKHSGCLRYGW